MATRTATPTRERTDVQPELPLLDGSPSASSMLDVFVARQPIFDVRGEVYAYELLYRRTGRHTTADGVSSDVMASEVLVNTFLNLGLDRVTEGARAFVNFTRDMLVSRVWQLMDPSAVVIELLETVSPDEEVIAEAKTLVEAGYTLALDDFEWDERFIPLLELASIVKLDVLGHDEAQIAARSARVASFGVQILAERVETHEVRDHCLQNGYSLFQGYYFSRPETLTTRDLSAAQLTILHLMNLLRAPDTNDGEIEDAFRGDVSLTYKLLRTVNSAAVGGRGIESIRHAVRLTGRGELHKWLSLLLVASVAGKGGTDAELARIALQRARMCEVVALQARDRRAAEALFMVGLFSLLDAILKVPLGDVLRRIELSDEVRRALLSRSGPYAPTLAMVEGYERASWATVHAECETLGLDPALLGEIYVEAVQWARERLEHVA